MRKLIVTILMMVELTAGFSQRHVPVVPMMNSSKEDNPKCKPPTKIEMMLAGAAILFFSVFYFRVIRPVQKEDKQNKTA